MLTAAILLTVLGLLLVQWLVSVMNRPVAPLIFRKQIGIVIFILPLVMMIGGLYCFWQVNYIISVIIICLTVILFTYGRYLMSEKSKIKKIHSLYSHVKAKYPFDSERDILRITAKLYFENLGWSEQHVAVTIESMFDEARLSHRNDIKSLIREILIFEFPSKNIRLSIVNGKYAERDRIIDEVCNLRP